MRKTVSAVVLAIVCTFAFFYILGVTVYKEELKTTPSATTPRAHDQTYRNAFVSACSAEGAKTSVCACIYDKLDKMYPDWTTNNERLDRIVNEGYSSAETDIMVSCVQQSEVKTD